MFVIRKKTIWIFSWLLLLLFEGFTFACNCNFNNLYTIYIYIYYKYECLQSYCFYSTSSNLFYNTGNNNNNKNAFFSFIYFISNRPLRVEIKIITFAYRINSLNNKIIKISVPYFPIYAHL